MSALPKFEPINMGEPKHPKWKRPTLGSLVNKLRDVFLRIVVIPHRRRPLHADCAAYERTPSKDDAWWITYAYLLERADWRIRFLQNIEFDRLKVFIPAELRRKLLNKKYRNLKWHELDEPTRIVLRKGLSQMGTKRYRAQLRRMRILTALGKIVSVIFSASSALATIGALIAAQLVPGGYPLILLASALIFSTFYIRGRESLTRTPNMFLDFFGGDYFCQGLLEHRNAANQRIRMPTRKRRQIKIAGALAFAAGCGMALLSYKSLLFAFIFFGIPTVPYIILPLVIIAGSITFMSTLSTCRRLIRQEDKAAQVRDYFKSLFRPNHPRNKDKKVWQVYLESTIACILVPAFIVLISFNIYGNALSSQLVAIQQLERIPTISATIAFWIALSVLLIPAFCGRLIRGCSDAMDLALKISRGTPENIQSLKSNGYQRKLSPNAKKSGKRRKFWGTAIEIFCSAADTFTSSLFATQNNIDGIEKVMVISGSGIKPLAIVAGANEEEKTYHRPEIKINKNCDAVLEQNPLITPIYQKSQQDPKPELLNKYGSKWVIEKNSTLTPGYKTLQQSKQQILHSNRDYWEAEDALRMQPPQSLEAAKSRLLKIAGKK